MPVILVIQPDRGRFNEAIARLAARINEPFAVLTLTPEHHDIESRGLLGSAEAHLVALESRVTIKRDGRLVAKKSALAILKGKIGLKGGSRKAVPDGILSLGRLRYRPGFEDVWLGRAHYDLRTRTKARLCIRYLAEQRAVDGGSARHLIDEIDPFVRERGNFPRAADIKIDHYFTDRTGKLSALRKELIGSAGRNGRYFLKVE
jgi:hypothetical protein